MKIAYPYRFLLIIGVLVILSLIVMFYSNGEDKTSTDEPEVPIVEVVPIIEKEPINMVEEQSKYKKASELGMAKDNADAGDSNADIFTTALNNNGGITIDGSYYIGYADEDVTNNQIEIIGMDGAELIFDNEDITVLFDPNELKSLTIRNLGFVNLNIKKSLFIVHHGDEGKSTKTDKIIIEDSTFDGEISLYRDRGVTSMNPNTVDFGIDTFVFNNNTVTNTTLSFIVLTDMPLRHVEIGHNDIRNFKYVFFNASITNGIQYEDEIFESRDYMHVHHNTVINDDDWWAQEGSGSYHAFVLVENLEVLYEFNHVEGLKADFDVSLYDAYLSSRFVTYTNNTWINNVSFEKDKIYNNLIKSKGGNVNGVPVNRVYTNNTFIIEESYAERLGQSKEDLFVYFYDLTTSADNYTIENNIIDVYDLRFVKSSDLISHFKFNNNVIKAKYALGSLVIIRLTDDDLPTIQVNNNTVEIEQTNDHPSGDDVGLRMIGMVDDRSTKTNTQKAELIEMKGNTIVAPLTYLMYNTIAKKIEVDDNSITVIGERFVSMVNNDEHPQLLKIDINKK
ncbi:protein of unknown function [Petrocella atlantisensis]|uniref:Right handed beta helix domain-containing protein n=2 Tax=Petrocella atlantisensis TaxID=2173034 RepID=A0A3P7RZP5_9FIRM|nr:protein of unknown function [Petrocella atlantisensis]